MANPADIVRTISGKGEIRITDDFQDTSSIFLYVQVLRKSTNVSINYTWNPDKSFYAHVAFCIDDFVLQTYDVNFEQQAFQVWDGMSAQNLLATKCLASQLIPGESLIAQMEYNSFQANKIKFECFASTALKLTLKGDALDVCLEEHKRPQPPPPPPPPLPQVPPGTPVQVSPGYDDPQGDADTDPFPADEEESGNQGETCQAYNVVYSYTATSDGSPPNRIENQIINLWGEIGAIRAGRDANNDPQILIECRDLADFQPCGDFAEYGVNTLIGAGLSVTFSDPTIDSIN